jgi:putative membrane protein
MFEYLTLLLPFLLLGFIAAGLSRISGVALSMIIVPTLLIWGATPLDVVAFMLLFVVYNNFTSETQDVRLDYKDLVLFPKWRLLIPLVLTVVGIFINPAIGIAVFMACFVLELLATVFKRIPEQERPAVHRVHCTFRSQCYCNRYWRLCRSYY